MIVAGLLTGAGRLHSALKSRTMVGKSEMMVGKSETTVGKSGTTVGKSGASVRLGS